jgi:hypothetical protein
MNLAELHQIVVRLLFPAARARDVAHRCATLWTTRSHAAELRM